MTEQILHNQLWKTFTIFGKWPQEYGFNARKIDYKGVAEVTQYQMDEHFTGFAKKNTTRPDDMCMIFEEYLQELSCLDILLYPELETKQGNEDRNFTSIEVSFKLRMHGPFSRWRNLTKTTRSHLWTIALLCTRKQQSGGF